MIIPPLRAMCLECQAWTTAHTLKNTARNNLVVYYGCPCGCDWSRFYRAEDPLQETLARDENNRYATPRQLRQLIPPSDDDNWIDMRL